MRPNIWIELFCMNCIYCKTRIVKGKNDSDEHIFPDSFGCPSGLIINCVCRKCNNDLGGKIDRFLAYETHEADKRIRIYKRKTSGSISYYKRLKRGFPYETEYGDFQGVKIDVNFNNPEKFFIPGQIGIPKNGKYEYITIQEIQKTDIRNNIGKLPLKDFRIAFQNESELKKGERKLISLGVIRPNYKIKRKQTGIPKNIIINGKIPIQMTAIIDQEICRAFAKISFNYLTKIKGWQYVMHDKFDDIRNYIRNGFNPKKIRFVIPNVEPILYYDSANIKFFEGFLVNLELVERNLISKVSMYNDITYQVFLTQNSEQIWYPFRIGLGYDFKKKKILPMVGFNSSFLLKK